MYITKPKFWDNPRLTLWAILLYPLSLILIIITLIRKLISNETKFNIPIICVGNIYLGGTGKTPTSIAIYNIVKSFGKKPAIVKKYYKFLDDEVAMIKNFGEVFTDKKRKSAIEDLIKNNNDVAILDDGFQDLSIKKNLSILCFNSYQWIGNGLTIPAGPLRETKYNINNADCILINGKSQKFADDLNNIKIPIFYTNYKVKNLENFNNEKFIAFAGIGNPSNFFDLLNNNKIKFIKSYSFPDHHNYSDFEIEKMINECKSEQAQLITTEKDYFRLDSKLQKKCQYLKVELTFEDENKFKNFIKKFI